MSIAEIKGMVADIQHCSVHDGPGIRTTVFLKGCPLHCAWCHNPECISFEPEMMYYSGKCIGCGKCNEGCFTGAKVICGSEMSVKQVMAEVSKDRPYYGDDGGITLSGGEPLSQHEFSYALLKECKKDHIHCAVESSLFAQWETAKTVLEICDFIMCDMKVWDDDIHKKYTGVSNNVIKENIRKLDSIDIPFIVRTPVVCGVNNNIDEISKIAEFASSLKNLQYYELLPYHPLGVTKLEALGTNTIQRFEVLDNRQVEVLASKAKEFGIEVRISGGKMI